MDQPTPAKPTVTIEPPKAKSAKRLPTVDNLDDNWLLRRFINQQLAKDDRDLRAILISGANYAEVEKLYVSNGGSEANIVAALKSFMDFYGKK